MGSNLDRHEINILVNGMHSHLDMLSKVLVAFSNANFDYEVKSIDGIKTARWNVVNGKMKVKFNPELTNLDDIHKAIALVGYDTELYKATDESYNNLHFCCKYERPIEKE